MKWISVKERLPEPGKPILLTDGEWIEVGCYTKNNHQNEYRPYEMHFDWCSCCSSLDAEITHWAEIKDFIPNKVESE